MKKEIAVIVLGIFVLGSSLICKAGEEGLIGYWNFDKGSGNVLKDNSDNGNDADIVGAQWVKLKKGYALKFSGMPDCVKCRNAKIWNDTIKGTNPFTVEEWINIPAGSAGYNPQFNKGADGHGFTIFSLGRIAGGDGTNKFDNSGMFGAVAKDEWVHTAIVYTGTEMIGYRDGREQKRFNWTYGCGNSTNDLCLGVFWADYFKGMIDEVRIYNRALTVQEIQGHYDGEKENKSDRIIP